MYFYKIKTTIINLSKVACINKGYNNKMYIRFDCRVNSLGTDENGIIEEDMFSFGFDSMELRDEAFDELYDSLLKIQSL
jgi:hypothetical protein